MENREQYIYKWHRNVELSIMVHICLLVLNILFLGLFTTNEPKIVFLVLFLVSLFSHTPIFIYSFYFGWNVAIYFNNEKVWTKMKGKEYEWRWDEMTDCYAITGFWFRYGQPIIVMVTKLDYKLVTFAYSPLRYKKLMEICPNEIIKTKLQKEFSDPFA